MTIARHSMIDAAQRLKSLWRTFTVINPLRSLLIAVAFASVVRGSAADATRPNILFIMVDEMRWNVMSCAGHPLVQTPNLDRLAREGTRFATAYTAAAICAPARYSLFTSR